MFTEKQLAEILAVCEKATPGPWDFDEDIWWENTPGEQEKHGGLIVYPLANEDLTVAGVNHYFDRKQGKANAQLIALARTVLPQLAQRVLELEGEVDPYWMNKAQELDTENAKLRAVAEAASLHVIAEVRGTWDDRRVLFAELKQALATAGYGGEE